MKPNNWKPFPIEARNVFPVCRLFSLSVIYTQFYTTLSLSFVQTVADPTELEVISLFKLLFLRSSYWKLKSKYEIDILREQPQRKLPVSRIDEILANVENTNTAIFNHLLPSYWTIISPLDSTNPSHNIPAFSLASQRISKPYDLQLLCHTFQLPVLTKQGIHGGLPFSCRTSKMLFPSHVWNISMIPQAETASSARPMCSSQTLHSGTCKTR